MLTIEKLEGPDEVTVHLSGKVEMSSVPLVNGCVRSVGKRRLVLDFSHVDTSDAALGAIVDSAPCAHVTYRGLKTHQERILSYLQRVAPRA